MGMQRLGEELFDPDTRLDPDPELVDPATGVVSLSKRRRKASATGLTPQTEPLQQPEQEPPSESGVDRREIVSTLLEIVGLLLFSAGFWLVHVWLGLIVTGLCLVVLGVATSDQFTRPRDLTP
jgi:hypothetical protein